MSVTIDLDDDLVELLEAATLLTPSEPIIYLHNLEGLAGKHDQPYVTVYARLSHMAGAKGINFQFHDIDGDE